MEGWCDLHRGGGGRQQPKGFLTLYQGQKICMAGLSARSTASYSPSEVLPWDIPTWLWECIPNWLNVGSHLVLHAKWHCFLNTWVEYYRHLISILWEWGCYPRRMTSSRRLSLLRGFWVVKRQEVWYLGQRDQQEFDNLTAKLELIAVCAPPWNFPSREIFNHDCHFIFSSLKPFRCVEPTPRPPACCTCQDWNRGHGSMTHCKMTVMLMGRSREAKCHHRLERHPFQYQLPRSGFHPWRLVQLQHRPSGSRIKIRQSLQPWQNQYLIRGMAKSRLIQLNPHSSHCQQSIWANTQCCSWEFETSSNAPHFL